MAFGRLRSGEAGLHLFRNGEVRQLVLPTHPKLVGGDQTATSRLDVGRDFRSDAIMGTGVAVAVISVGDCFGPSRFPGVIGLRINCGADGGVRVEFQFVRAAARFARANRYAARAHHFRNRLADLGKNPNRTGVDAARPHYPFSASERRDADQRSDRLCVFVAGARRVRMAAAKTGGAGFGVVRMDALASFIPGFHSLDGRRNSFRAGIHGACRAARIRRAFQ